MKTLLAVISAIVIMGIYGFMQGSNVKELLEKPDTRKEIINTILNSHSYMTEFIQAMHGNEHAMMMMNGNGQMSGNNMMSGMSGNNMMNQGENQMGSMNNGQYPMMNQSQMMNMMHQNPQMMQMMMGNMMNAVSTDSTMSHNMVNMMYRNPQMMQMMMQMMHNNNMGNPGSSGGNTSSIPAPKNQ